MADAYKYICIVCVCVCVCNILFVAYWIRVFIDSPHGAPSGKKTCTSSLHFMSVNLCVKSNVRAKSLLFLRLLPFVACYFDRMNDIKQKKKKKKASLSAKPRAVNAWFDIAVAAKVFGLWPLSCRLVFGKWPFRVSAGIPPVLRSHGFPQFLYKMSGKFLYYAGTA